jgi:hypothetical protein
MNIMLSGREAKRFIPLAKRLFASAKSKGMPVAWTRTLGARIGVLPIHNKIFIKADAVQLLLASGETNILMWHYGEADADMWSETASGWVDDIVSFTPGNIAELFGASSDGLILSDDYLFGGRFSYSGVPAFSFWEFWEMPVVPQDTGGELQLTTIKIWVDLNSGADLVTTVWVMDFATQTIIASAPQTITPAMGVPINVAVSATIQKGKSYVYGLTIASGNITAAQTWNRALLGTPLRLDTGVWSGIADSNEVATPVFTETDYNQPGTPIPPILPQFLDAGLLNVPIGQGFLVQIPQLFYMRQTYAIDSHENRFLRIRRNPRNNDNGGSRFMQWPRGYGQIVLYRWNATTMAFVDSFTIPVPRHAAIMDTVEFLDLRFNFTTNNVEYLLELDNVGSDQETGTLFSGVLSSLHKYTIGFVNVQRDDADVVEEGTRVALSFQIASADGNFPSYAAWIGAALNSNLTGQYGMATPAFQLEAQVV